MPLIQAYQCPRTGRLFANKHLYLYHLKSLAKQNRLNKLEARLQRDHANVLAKMRNSVESLDELTQFITDNSATFYLNKKLHGFNWDVGRGPRPGLGKIRSVCFSRIQYYNSCSNSHCSPIGKPENWYRDDDKPCGYPGWMGRMKFTCDDRPGFMTGLFTNTGINTGTGGSNEYTVTLFADDWPGLVRTAMINKLAGGTENDITICVKTD